MVGIGVAASDDTGVINNTTNKIKKDDNCRNIFFIHFSLANFIF